ncbi:hypothetical protein [Rhodocista pekingensis]|uniref:Uncharacterized protein n=1 Tax=Rhodocista pekingensis TaxID=201185 RepID=A0ABW2KXR0_9PROT
MQIGRYDQIARSPRHQHAGGAAPETGGAVSGGVASGAVPGAAGDGTAAAESAARATREATAAAEDEHGLSFWDVLDVINPLQHIPIVNRLYRAVTGDEIREPARLAGSALLFGPVGLAVAAADMVLEKETGSDAFTHVASLFKGKDAAPDGQEEEQVLLAAADPAEAPAGQLRRAAVPEPLTAAAPVPYTAGAPAPLPGQARGLAAMPAGSAAAMALSGLPAAAAVGSLPAPGDGAQLAELAAGAKEAAGRDAPRGMDLSRYRRLAEAGGPVAPKSIVPPTPVQSAQGAAFVAATAHPPPAARPSAPTSAPASAVPPAAVSSASAVPPAAAAAPATASAAASAASASAAAAPAGAPAGGPWPPSGPAALPREFVADMMMLAMNKYEAQARSRQAPGSSVDTRH